MESEHFDRHPDCVTPVDEVETTDQVLQWGIWLGLMLGMGISGVIAVLYAIVEHA